VPDVFFRGDAWMSARFLGEDPQAHAKVGGGSSDVS